MKKNLEKTILISDDDSIALNYSETDGIMYLTIFNAEKSCDLKISLTRGIELGYELTNVCNKLKREYEQ